MDNKFLKVLLFICIVIAADKMVGFICQKLYFKSKDFTISKLRYSLDSTTEDVLILGSSRAEHHFFTPIIKQNIGLSIYNCGIGGQDLTFSLIQLHESLKRYRPRFVIVEVSPSSLFLPNPEENLKVLLPYYKRDPLIFNVFTNGKIFEKIKFLSSIYPYNSTIASLLKGIFKHASDTYKGFQPLYGILDTNGLAKKMYAGLPSLLPPEKFTALKQIITMCQNNNIRVVIVNSPVYLTNKVYDAVSNQIKIVCSQYKNVQYLDYSKYGIVYNHLDFFYDHTHLNYNGAMIFSQAISKQLANILREK